MQAPINAHSNWLNKYGITPREAEVLDLILQGIDSNQEIAEKLAFSVQRPPDSAYPPWVLPSER